MNWFQRLTGFDEATGPQGYESNRARLEVDGAVLRSRVNGRRYGIGQLELVSLQALRDRARAVAPVPGERRVRVVQGDVGAFHADPAFAGALFQVASQFNLLEMVSPHVTPEHGVAGYENDRTQGPACAIAAGAATIFRNYFAPVAGARGQTHDRQYDGFADLGAAIAQGLAVPPESLWTMRNGYAMFKRAGLEQVSAHLAGAGEDGRDALRQRLKIGLHQDVEVTSGAAAPGPLVSQAFCSALPVSYHGSEFAPAAAWQPLAQLVLEAAYEATLWAAVVNAQRGASGTVLLTLLGGGAFGNDERWIRAAMTRAVQAVAGHGLEIVLVSYREPAADWLRWAREAD